MSKLDLAKEQIAYLKVWLGVVIALFGSLIGWLLNNAETIRPQMLIAALIALIMIAFSGYRIHRRIEVKINALEDL